MTRKKTAPCKTCYGYGLWGFGSAAPMGPSDAKDGMGTRACPECGANANPIDAKNKDGVVKPKTKPVKVPRTTARRLKAEKERDEARAQLTVAECKADEVDARHSEVVQEILSERDEMVMRLTAIEEELKQANNDIADKGRVIKELTEQLEQIKTANKTPQPDYLDPQFVAERISKFVNCQGMEQMRELAQMMSNDHRYLVQTTMQLVMLFIGRLAENYDAGYFDARNECACKVAKAITKMPDNLFPTR
jgi:hypothetical protein